MKIARMPFNRFLFYHSGGIPTSLFKDMLDLMPQDTTFMGCGSDSSSAADFLFFQSDLFIDTKEGCIPPDITPHFIRKTDGTASIEKVDLSNALADNKNCFHVYITYSGFHENYEYCKLCNARKS